MMMKWLLCQKFCWKRRENLHQRELGGATQTNEGARKLAAERKRKQRERERIRELGKDKTSDDDVEL